MKKFFQEETFCHIFNVFSILMFSILFHYCLSLTGVNKEITDEFISIRTDSIVWNLLRICISLFCLYFLGKLSEKLKSKKTRNILLGIVCAVCGTFSFYWVIASKSAPQADQLLLCWAAEAFNQGDFGQLETGGYLARYPQQLGMVTLLRILFKIFGNMNYLAFQYLTAALVPLLVLSGCKIVRFLSDNNVKTEFYYLFFIICCFPMYAYTSFVYGDLISIILGLFGIWMYLSCLQKFSWPRLVLFGVSIGLAVQLRQNLLILVIALAIVMLVKLLSGHGKKQLVMAVALALGCGMMQIAVWGIYHDVRPKDAPAIPALLFIVMGLNDDYQRAGWHNEYEYSTFATFQDNVELSMEKAQNDLHMYLELYQNDPDYMIDFFIRKMNSQWNAPMYQSLVMNNYTPKEQLPLVRDIYHNKKLSSLIESGMKTYQLLLYGSTLFLLAVRRKNFVQIEKYLLLIAVFGGFLFSLMWEAKTRYIMPYLLMQIPYLSMGVGEIIAILENSLARRRTTNQ